MSSYASGSGRAELLWRKKNGLIDVLDTFKEQFSLHALDIITAGKFAKEKCALFALISFLSAAFRQGHLFIKVTENKILPEPELILAVQEGKIGDFKSLRQAITTAFFELTEHPAVIKEGSKLYFKNGWQKQAQAHFHYERLKACTPNAVASFSLDSIQLIDGKSLEVEQACAIRHALTSPLSCIFGGPGTGKTYTAGIFLQCFLDAYPKNELPFLRIALAGPTGKATANLEKSIQRALGKKYETLKKQIDVKTLHALLGMRRFTSKREVPTFLPYQLYIVDESSMVDVSLMAEFLAHVRTGAKVLFLGDPYQLPPVEPGEIFSDFVKKESVGGLERSRRTNLNSILDLAKYVKEGNVEKALELLRDGNSSTTFHCVDNNPQELKKVFEKEKERFSQIFTELLAQKVDPKQLLGDLNQFRLLSPLQDGPWGVKTINRYFHHLLEPVMISQNDYQLNLMNGEIGVLEKQTECAFFLGKKENEIRKIPSILLSHFERAYALSVHKSQGSEFDHVVLFLPPGSEVFGRKMLYTAITRARKKIEIWGSLETLKACIIRDNR